MVKNLLEKVNGKLLIASTVLMVAAPVFATETTGAATTMLDTSKIDFTPLLATIAAVIGVALVPIISVAAGKKGLGFLKWITNKIG